MQCKQGQSFNQNFNSFVLSYFLWSFIFPAQYLRKKTNEFLMNIKKKLIQYSYLNMSVWIVKTKGEKHERNENSNPKYSFVEWLRLEICIVIFWCLEFFLRSAFIVPAQHCYVRWACVWLNSCCTPTRGGSISMMVWKELVYGICTALWGSFWMKGAIIRVRSLSLSWKTFSRKQFHLLLLTPHFSVVSGASFVSPRSVSSHLNLFVCNLITDNPIC